MLLMDTQGARPHALGIPASGSLPVKREPCGWRGLHPFVALFLGWERGLPVTEQLMLSLARKSFDRGWPLGGMLLPRLPSCDWCQSVSGERPGTIP